MKFIQAAEDCSSPIDIKNKIALYSPNHNRRLTEQHETIKNKLNSLINRNFLDPLLSSPSSSKNITCTTEQAPMVIIENTYSSHSNKNLVSPSPSNSSFNEAISHSSSLDVRCSFGQLTDNDSSKEKLALAKSKTPFRASSRPLQPSLFNKIHHTQRQATCYSNESSESSASERVLAFAKDIHQNQRQATCYSAEYSDSNES